MAETAGHKRARKKSKTRWWTRWYSLLTGVAVLIGLAASIITILGAWPHHDTGITFMDPSSNGVTPEPCVFTVSGQGTPPAGQVLLLSNQMQGTSDKVDPYLHFVRATMKPNTATWYADMVIGLSSTKGGTPYTLTTWLANGDWAKYLTQVTPNQVTWWSTLEPPPGAKKVETANVTRTAGGMIGCPDKPK
jgi:hypothetical protein